jgi:SAM-dependent methyltransferase
VTPRDANQPPRQDARVQFDPVRQYYASFGEREWLRLDSDEGVIEFRVNTHYLDQHLPQSGRILDLGGGPGRYSEWLAARGHRGVLTDLSPELLALARERVVSPLIDEISEADARDLSRWDDASFDAALVLGPLYHLPDESDREQVVAEVCRVVRPGGLVAFALIPVYAFIRRTATIADECRHLSDEAFVHRLMTAGAFDNDLPGRFTHGWGTRPEAVAPWFERFGLETIALIASEGFAAFIEPSFAAMREREPRAFETAMRLIIETAADPSLLGSAKHLLYLARNQEPSARAPVS